MYINVTFITRNLRDYGHIHHNELVFVEDDSLEEEIVPQIRWFFNRYLSTPQTVEAEMKYKYNNLKYEIDLFSTKSCDNKLKK